MIPLEEVIPFPYYFVMQSMDCVGFLLPVRLHNILCSELFSAIRVWLGKTVFVPFTYLIFFLMLLTCKNIPVVVYTFFFFFSSWSYFTLGLMHSLYGLQFRSLLKKERSTGHFFCYLLNYFLTLFWTYCNLHLSEIGFWR